MGRVIVVGAVIVILGLLIAGVVVWFRRQSTKEMAAEKGWAIKGDLSRNQERAILLLLHDAGQILHDLRNPPVDALDYVSYLSPDDRSKVEQWLQSYEKGKLTIK
jgi:hypothetical protein